MGTTRITSIAKAGKLYEGTIVRYDGGQLIIEKSDGADLTRTNLSEAEKAALAAQLQPTPEPAPIQTYYSGVQAGRGRSRDPEYCAQLGARVARVEFDINTPAINMDSVIKTYTDRGIKVLLLAGFARRIPTSAEANNLGTWAARHGNSCPWIEFGNETNYTYQYGDTSGSDPDYINRAKIYAQRCVEAYNAIKSSNINVKLLAQGDDAGFGDNAWTNNMRVAVPNLSNYVDGWTIHPYGPRVKWESRMDRMMNDLQNKGWTKPTYITEYGISTDDGKTLENNYGWPVNMTYSAAATALRDSYDQIRQKYGAKLAMFIYYNNADLMPSGTGRRENHFGALRVETWNGPGYDKGPYTIEVKRILST